MSDDSFFREVEEELRSDRLKSFWEQYGNYAIAAAVALVVAVAGYQFWQGYQQSQAAAAGDAFMEAVREAEAGETEPAMEKLRAIASEGSATYRALAQMRLGAELAKQNKWDEAVAAYDAAAQLSGVDDNLTAIARLRAGAILVDQGTVTDVQARVGELAEPGKPYRASAREYLALAYYKAGDLDEAAKRFQTIRDDTGTPGTLGQRARLMLELIASQGGPAVNAENAPANG